MATGHVENANVNLDWIVERLRAPGWDVPNDALLAAREHRDLIVPRLIQLIRDATDAVAAGAGYDELPGHAHFFALFLLTEFRAREALPAIVDAISVGNNDAYTLFGDALYEIVPRTLTVLAPSCETLDKLILNSDLDIDVRATAASTYLCFVRSGRLSRDDAVNSLQTHLQSAIADADTDLVQALVAALADYSPAEALDDIERAFSQNLVDLTYVDMPYVRESIARGDEWFQKSLKLCNRPEIEDAIGELHDWFDELGTPDPYEDDNVIEDDFYGDDLYDDDFDDAYEPDDLPPVDTIRNVAPKVGRNDPCPCGSGKKYKKCCMNG